MTQTLIWPLRELVRLRPNTEFLIPVQQWMLNTHQSKDKSTRRLRGRARKIYSIFTECGQV